VHGAADAGCKDLRAAKGRVDVVGPRVGDIRPEDGALCDARLARHLEDPVTAVRLRQVELQPVGEREHIEAVWVVARGRLEGQRERLDGVRWELLVDRHAHLVEGREQDILAGGELAIRDGVASGASSCGGAACEGVLEREPLGVELPLASDRPAPVDQWLEGAQCRMDERGPIVPLEELRNTGQTRLDLPAGVRGGEQADELHPDPLNLCNVLGDFRVLRGERLPRLPESVPPCGTRNKVLVFRVVQFS
jgi:hypothetical protein